LLPSLFELLSFLTYTTALASTLGDKQNSGPTRSVLVTCWGRSNSRDRQNGKKGKAIQGVQLMSPFRVPGSYVGCSEECVEDCSLLSLMHCFSALIPPCLRVVPGSKNFPSCPDYFCIWPKELPSIAVIGSHEEGYICGRGCWCEVGKFHLKCMPWLWLDSKVGGRGQ
jgi:hypothetical protein